MENTVTARFLDGALTPRGWDSIEGLVCGFGDRFISAPPGTALLLRQVHGDRIVDADALSHLDGAGFEDGLARLPVDADAAVSTQDGCTVGVRTADCVPVLLVSARDRWAAAVHAGWRGTFADIVVRAVEQAVASGVAPSSLRAALGPSIGPCCYEVSDDLARQFQGKGHAVVSASDGRGPRLDLRAINASLLVGAGVAREHIQLCGPCTRCASDRYHSFRAEPQCEGRQVSWVGWQARTPPPDR